MNIERMRLRMKGCGFKIGTMVLIIVIFAAIAINADLGLGYNIVRKVDSPIAIDDLIVEIQTNQSRIGRNGAVLVTLNISNQGLNPVIDFQASFNLTGAYGRLSSNYPANQEISQINPLTNSTMNVEVVTNVTQDPSQGMSVDICLLFDASGSMGEEIGSVKAKFLEITDQLTQQIPSLRIGMIVYGWNKYSEYPTSSQNNYIEFTEDIEAVNTFIQGLYAAGGKEPWGDAFYLANSWTWRENAQKLIIIVGDEDCDVGNIVGKGSTGDHYNGTQLLNVITGLKEKGVQINSILTKGYSSIVEDQFTWISEYTDGVCVKLEELETGETPITLPELIEEWTLSLAREYSLKLTMDFSWTEVDPQGNIDHTLRKTRKIWVDLAPPSISYSKFLEEEDGTYSYKIYSTPRDLSGITATNLYWTKDDLSTEPEPIWQFKNMELLEDNKTYFATITNLILQQKLSFYIESMDSVGNVGKTVIENVTVVPEYQAPGTVNEFMLLQDNSTQWLHFASPSGTKGFLWINAEQNLTITFKSNNVLNSDLIFSGNESKIYELRSLSSTPFNFSCILEGNKSQTKIQVYWATEIAATLGSVSGTLDETTRTLLWKVQIYSSEDGFLSLIIHDSELVVNAYVYSSDWERKGVFNAISSLNITAGTYYLWVVHIVRTGSFSIKFDQTVTTTSDEYQSIMATTTLAETTTEYQKEYLSSESGTPGFSSFILFLGILFLSLLRIQKFRKLVDLKIR